MTTSTTSVTLLAPRMRVEERLLIAAFGQRNSEALLRDVTTMAFPLANGDPKRPSLVLDREIATADRSTLAALIAASGATVVNRAATVRLLSDRLALLRHLIIAGIPTPATIVAFGEESAVEALAEVGYPALLQSIHVNLKIPDAVVFDRDAGEAAIEHRSMLGRETALLVQQYVLGNVARIVVVGSDVVAIESICSEGGNTTFSPYDGSSTTLSAIGAKVVSRLGSGVYAVEVVESESGPVVVGASNLVDFRTLNEAGVDIAGKIAEFTLSQSQEAQDGS